MPKNPQAYMELQVVKEEIYIIDGSSYIYRAYHAITPLSNSKGMPTHAVLGFVNMVKRLIREKNPKYLIIAFDSRGPVFRHRLYDQYKANRPSMPEDLSVQIPYIKRFVAASNITMLEEQDVEADDIIASVAKKFTALGQRVVIVSGDKDLLQLISDDVAMWDPMKDKLMDQAEVKKKYGVPPEQLLDLFALIGDSSDNVPGVPGVGPKTAEKLIVDFANLEGLYAHVDELKKSKLKEKIIEYRDQAFLSRELINLKSDVEIPGLESYFLRQGNDQQLAEIYTELEFSSLLKGIDTSTAVPVEGFVTVRNSGQLADLLDALQDAEILAVDTETTSLNARKAGLVGISLCTELERAWYIPIGHLDADGKLAEGQMDGREVLAALKPFLLSKDLKKVCHNLKYDFTVLKQQWGIELGGPLADTLIAAYLIENEGRSLKLDALCLQRGLKMTSFDEVVAGNSSGRLRCRSLTFLPKWK
jgi:DNA polymerase-1